MSTDDQYLRTWVEKQLDECRTIALRYFRSSGLRIERKADRSPVTVADRRIEERLRHAIEQAFPGEAIVGEEFGFSGSLTETYWTIDPIDGTRAFSRGLPSWGILIGRVEKGQATLGLCDFPAIDTRLAAVLGNGNRAYERVGRITHRLALPPAVKKLDDAVIFHGGSHWWRDTPFTEGFTRVVQGCYLERAYGDCYGYLWALRGAADAVIEYGVKPWDMVPFAVLAEATGRVLTDFSGKPCWTGPQAVFASPAVARAIGKILRGGQ